MFVNNCLLSVNFVRNKCNHGRDSIIEECIHNFCMSETWLGDKDSATILVLNPVTHVFHHGSSPVKKCWVAASLASHYNLNISRQKFWVSRVHWTSAIKWRGKLTLNVIYRPPYDSFSILMQKIEVSLTNKIHVSEII